MYVCMMYMKRFEYEKYGEGVMTDIIKTAGKKAAEKAATSVGEYAGKKAGDKIIELLSRRKSGTKSGGMIKRGRGRPRKIK